MKGKLTMTERPGSDSGKSGTAVAMFIAAAIAVLLAARWLARLDGLQLAGIAAAAVAMVLFGWWAVRPQRRLPRHRVRHMRLRLRLRLHPGPGHATLFELWLRWGRGAAARRARRARPSLSFWTRRLRPSQTSVLIGRAQYHRGLRVPAEEHVIFIAPPRKGKSGALAEIIECYPGPVVVTTTRGDLHALTAASRAARGPVHVWNPQRLARVASTMRWDLRPASAATGHPGPAGRLLAGLPDRRRNGWRRYSGPGQAPRQACSPPSPMVTPGSPGSSQAGSWASPSWWR